MAADISYNILINKRSGTVLTMGEPAIQAAIETSGIAVGELLFCEPDHMQDELQRMAKGDGRLIVGGGDGTIRECAAHLAGTKKAFGILPFGTMNLMAADLGITSLQNALNAYSSGADEHAIDAGFVNGELFLCCASIGTMPQASVYRENLRMANKLVMIPQLFWFVLNNLDKHKRERVVLEHDGKMDRFRTPSVVVSSNRYADSLKLTESNFKRRSLDGGEMAAYIATTKTRTAHLRLLARLLLGHWLNDPDVTEIVAKEFKLYSSHKKQLVSIDGEVSKMRPPLTFTLKPKHVRVLVPRQEAPA